MSSCGERGVPRFRAVNRHQLDRIPQFRRLSPDQRNAIKTVSAVLPFRANNYVIEQLIDWHNIPNDPVFQLTFPQAGMLEPEDFSSLQNLVRQGRQDLIQNRARKIQMRMNPHPSGQMDLNVPTVHGRKLPGAQHKYRETLLFFPSQGQTCHAYCTYCFRWPQFAGIESWKLAGREVETLVDYLREHTEISDLLLTGGDPMIMSASVLRRYIEPLLDPALEHLTTIRIGSKALSYWPYRFVSDRDADDLMRLFERVRANGRQLAFMAHFSHPQEMAPDVCRRAVQRLRDAGCTVRSQAPVIRHVNDDARAWADMWRTQVGLGIVPYYMFVARETGPKHYFEVSLARTLKVFTNAFNSVSGLARTVRGPTMSCYPGKVQVDGVIEVDGRKHFVLKMVQGRDPQWSGCVFFARFDSQAAWISDLEPSLGPARFFFDDAMQQMRRGQWCPSWQTQRVRDEQDSA